MKKSARETYSPNAARHLQAIARYAFPDDAAHYTYIMIIAFFNHKLNYTELRAYHALGDQKRCKAAVTRGVNRLKA